MRGESTPFYLWSRGAHRRIAEALPDVKLIAVIRDPIDRAYSNWMHLWSDGLEPESDFETAFALQDDRVRAGWAPFWRYRELGLYGEQLDHLYRYVDPERVLVVRYRDLVDEPGAAVNRVSRFLGIREGLVDAIPRDNSRSFVQPGWRPRLLGPAVRPARGSASSPRPRSGARCTRPSSRCSATAGPRTGRTWTPTQRSRLQEPFLDDIDLLSKLTGQDFADWLSPDSRGSYAQRAATVTPINARR